MIFRRNSVRCLESILHYPLPLPLPLTHSLSHSLTLTLSLSLLGDLCVRLLCRKSASEQVTQMCVGKDMTLLENSLSGISRDLNDNVAFVWVCPLWFLPTHYSGALCDFWCCWKYAGLVDFCIKNKFSRKLLKVKRKNT